MSSPYPLPSTLAKTSETGQQVRNQIGLFEKSNVCWQAAKPTPIFSRKRQVRFEGEFSQSVPEFGEVQIATLVDIAETKEVTYSVVDSVLIWAGNVQLSEERVCHSIAGSKMKPTKVQTLAFSLTSISSDFSYQGCSVNRFGDQDWKAFLRAPRPFLAQRICHVCHSETASGLYAPATSHAPTNLMNSSTRTAMTMLSKITLFRTHECVS